MSFQKKSFVVGHFRGIVFAGLLLFVGFMAFSWKCQAFTLLQQYDASTSTEISVDKTHIGEILTTSCDLTGIANNLTLALSTNATTSVILYFYKNPTQVWTFTKDINTNGIEQFINFDISSTTPIDLGECGSGFIRWYFNLERQGVGTQFIIYGSPVKYPQLPAGAECTPNGNCPPIIDLYFNLGGEVSATSTLPNPPSLPVGTCDNLGTFAGAFCQVLTYLFYPSNLALTQYSNLKDLIATKPPFGYWISIKNAIAGLTSTTTPAFALTSAIGEIPFFDTIKTGLVWILWIFFAFWIIKRIARFDF